MEFIIGVTGATGIIYAITLLEFLKNNKDVNTHLIISDWAKKNLVTETNYSIDYLESLPTFLYDNK